MCQPTNDLSAMVAWSQIIYFLEMLKFLNFSFLEEINKLWRENEESFQIFRIFFFKWNLQI
jgi:hypothetical protein